MAHSITKKCVQCGDCVPLCPEGAVQVENGEYWIDPTVCTSCEGIDAPYCLKVCPVDSPTALQPKKGRNKAEQRPPTSLELFLNGKNNAFASSIVVWEACNILTQRQSLNWQYDAQQRPYYERQVVQGQGKLQFYLHGLDDQPQHAAQSSPDANHEPEHFDLRAACLNLIFAAYAIGLNQPWTEEFVVNDQQLEYYLGLDKRKDLNKLTKLTLIKELVQQPCLLNVSVNWPSQGQVTGFDIPANPLWILKQTQYHFQEDSQGCKHLTGLTFHIQPGLWTKYFLNQQGYQERIAYYQYGQLPQSLLPTAMSIWQQHEGAVRLLFWLLFKVRIGQKQRITVQTLMRVAYGEARLNAACSGQTLERKKLLRLFEGDLATLYHYGLRPEFDPVTYPDEIQPFWARVVDLPDDADEALEFWINDGHNGTRLTDAAPRGKWNRLMSARILSFALPADWEQRLKRTKTRKSNKQVQRSAQIASSVSGQVVTEARQKLGLSQRALASQLGKSQSWVRDIERDRFQVSPQDSKVLSEVLSLPQESR